MTDTGFVPSADQASRLVRVHRRGPDGSLEPITMEISHREFFSGGGGLLSTGRDYLAFLQMLLHQGRFNGAELLRPETVSQIGQNQIGNLQLGIMKTAMPELSNDVDLFPGVRCGHGLASVVNAQQGRNGRSAGTLTWAGLFNTYYWIDPQKRVTGVILTQILPFADTRAVKLYGEFERGVYDTLQS
jgi:CubicO group peptidase (beta-lactamase class C family)